MSTKLSKPLTPEIASKRPDPTPAPPRRGVIRTKVSCVRCHDVFTDDVFFGSVHVCADCAEKLKEEIGASDQRGRLELMPPAAAAIDECIRVTKLEADDVLLLRLPRDASPEAIQDITTKLSASKIRCVVIAADVDVEVLRPSPTQETAR